MDIIKKHKNTATIKATNNDDLWYLSHIIEPGDILRGRTLRKITLGEDSKSAVKKAVYVSIVAERVENTDSGLRVSGKICEELEDVPKGSYHTLNIEEGTVFTLEKKQWLKYQLNRLEEASAEKTGKIMIVVFDRDEAYFAMMQKYGFKMISEMKGKVQKKADAEKVESNFFGEIAKQIEEYDKRHNLGQIIIASPGFWREYVTKEINDEIRKKVILATCSAAGKSGINEVIKRDEVKQALKNERAALEINIVEELLAEIGKGKLAAYGLKEVKEAVEMGAVRVLLVTDTLIFKKREDGSYNIIDEMMRNTEKMKGEVHVISSEHEGGKKLNGLGGIGALLRYKTG